MASGARVSRITLQRTLAHLTAFLVCTQALQDVENLRKLVESDLDQLEDLTQRTYASNTGPLGLGSPLGRYLGPRAMADLSTLRKIAASDLNLLQMQIMKGDPTLTFLRDSLCATTHHPHHHHHHHRRRRRRRRRRRHHPSRSARRALHLSPVQQRLHGHS